MLFSSYFFPPFLPLHSSPFSLFLLYFPSKVWRVFCVHGQSPCLHLPLLQSICPSPSPTKEHPGTNPMVLTSPEHSSWKSTLLLDFSVPPISPGFPSVQFSGSVVFSSLQPHGLHLARLPCPSPTPGVHSNSCPLCR